MYVCIHLEPLCNLLFDITSVFMTFVNRSLTTLKNENLQSKTSNHWFALIDLIWVKKSLVWITCSPVKSSGCEVAVAGLKNKEIRKRKWNIAQYQICMPLLLKHYPNSFRLDSSAFCIYAHHSVTNCSSLSLHQAKLKQNITTRTPAVFMVFDDCSHSDNK